jgi:hypothetical protein
VGSAVQKVMSHNILREKIYKKEEELSRYLIVPNVERKTNLSQTPPGSKSLEASVPSPGLDQ